MLLIPAGTFPDGGRAGRRRGRRRRETAARGDALEGVLPRRARGDERAVRGVRDGDRTQDGGRDRGQGVHGGRRRRLETAGRRVLEGAAAGGKRPAPDWAKHPVVLVSWSDAKAYAEWAEAALPTEAQFERALRGGRGDQEVPVGNRAPSADEGRQLCRREREARLQGLDGRRRLRRRLRADGAGRVSSPRTDYGLYGLSGNVWEWCADGYDKDYYAKSPSRDPLGADGSASRAARGGSWFSIDDALRASDRIGDDPASRLVSLGFRLARSL